MMTSKDKVKRFKTLLLSPHVLIDDEMRALWAIARHEGKIMFQYNNTNDSNPIISTSNGAWIIIPRYIIGTLERRGLLKRRNKHQQFVSAQFYHHQSWYTWDIVWKKAKSFEQTKELMVQKAVGAI